MNYNNNIFFSKENDTFIKINRLFKLHSIETYLQYKKKIIEVWETAPILLISYENFKYGLINNNSLFDEIFPNKIQNIIRIKFQHINQQEYIKQNFVIFYKMINKFILSHNLPFEINMTKYKTLNVIHPIYWLNYLTNGKYYYDLVKDWTRIILIYYFCKINKYEQH